MRKPVTKREMLNMSIEEKLSRTDFFVEADDFARYKLWKEYFGSNNRVDRLQWIEDTSGFYKVLGHIDGKGDMPVTVCFSFAVIGDRYVCFYHPTSRFVDWQIVNDFLDTNYPVKYDGGERKARTDANNFDHCYGFCQEDEFGDVNLDETWFAMAFNQAANEEGNGEEIENISVNVTDKNTVFTFDVDCGRMGLHRGGTVLIDKVRNKVITNLPEIIDSGGIGTNLRKQIEDKLKVFEDTKDERRVHQ